MNSRGGYIAMERAVQLTTYRHGSHWCLTEPRVAAESGVCDRVLTRDEITKFTEATNAPRS